MKQKKTITVLVLVALILISALAFTVFQKLNSPYDISSFSNSTAEALAKSINETADEAVSNLTSLINDEWIYCGDDFCFEAFTDGNKIYCAVFKTDDIKGEDKYLAVNYYDYTPDDITDESGTIPLNPVNKSDIIIGIMPGEHKGILINEKTKAYIIPISFNGKIYNCWIDTAAGGISKVKTIEYN